jgi:diaminohydroxyphosphoribosylaminopyrimidine deaminase/5-amino-6-(5-phosphoribosylamino)uracil reductase
VYDGQLARAHELGMSVLGRTSPNPPVGALALGADGRVLGEGATQPPGGPHAERVALNAATAPVHTVVSTLEPCNHTGRTGPCAQALIEAGVARVVYAHADPHHQAAGGAETLRAAGVEVVHAGGPEGALAYWLHRQRTGRPFVTWKYAATLDGRSAAADGTSQWITGEQARADVHLLRSQVDAIMAGSGTVLADDPALTARLTDAHSRPVAEDHQPLRVVVDRRGRVPATARALGAGSLHVTDDRDVLADLAERGIVRVLLEGGPTLAASFWSAGLVDEVVAYLAPALLGNGPAAVGDLGIGTIADIARLRITDITRLGEDVRLTMKKAA